MNKNIYFEQSNNFFFMKKRKILFLIIFQQIFILYLLNNNKYNKNNNLSLKNKVGNCVIQDQLNNNYTIIEKLQQDYNNSKFAILRRTSCPSCGLFSHYIVHLGCIREYISKGYIPLIDLGSFSNIFNGFNNSSLINPWEFFFNQPFNHTLNKVLKYSQKIKYFKCKDSFKRPYQKTIYLNKVLVNYWHNIANEYMPIKGVIINESNIIIKQLFNNNNNILGVLIRGTDYLAKKPRNHPIPPKVEMVIKDAKIMDKRNNYDYIFITTEDDIIRDKFVNKFVTKIKFYKYKHNINYNYKSKLKLAFNNSIKGNIDFMKIYLINIIILSKCIDILAARTSGTAGVFILTNGFRNNKLYFLGDYK